MSDKRSLLGALTRVALGSLPITGGSPGRPGRRLPWVEAAGCAVPALEAVLVRGLAAGD